MATPETPPLPAGDTAYLYRAAIGPRGQDYYLRHFARFDGDGRSGASWNWAAYWTTFNWMAYRKMWGWLMAYVGALLGLLLLIFGVGKLMVGYSDSSAALLSLALLTAAFVVPGLYGNAWFYAHCNDRITLALRATQDLKQAATLLSSQAPGGRRLIVQMVGNALLAALVALLYFNLPSGEGLPMQLASTSGRVGDAPVVADPAPRAIASAASAPLLATSTAGNTAGNTAASTVPEPAAGAEAPLKVLAAEHPAEPVAAARAAGSAAAKSRERTGTVSAAPVPAAQPVVAAASPATPAAPAAAPVPAGPEPVVAASRPVPKRHYVWVIQVGAFAQGENADHALAVVQALGYEAGEEKYRTKAGDQLTRVRVGPFTQQGEAETAAERIRGQDLPTLLFRQRP